MNNFLLLLAVLMIQKPYPDYEGIIFDDPYSVTIILDELPSKKIPNLVWDSLEIKKLTIHKTRPKSTWKTSPPLSWYETRDLKPPFWELPSEIANLKNLESLYLVDLDINHLPEAITELQKIKVLDLSLNKLILHNEVDKFEKLKKLKDLKIIGNHYDNSVMEEFKENFRDINIEYSSEDK